MVVGSIAVGMAGMVLELHPDPETETLGLAWALEILKLITYFLQQGHT